MNRKPLRPQQHGAAPQQTTQGYDPYQRQEPPQPAQQQYTQPIQQQYTQPIQQQYTQPIQQQYTQPIQQQYSQPIQRSSYGQQTPHAQQSYYQQQPSPPQQQHPFASNPSAQLGIQLGAQALSAGQEYVNQQISSYIPFHLLKYYFDVTNSFVFWKLLLILFPFRHSTWSRMTRQDQTGKLEFVSPRHDLNAPDLYIPSMAFATYCIINAALMGMRGKFRPELLGMTASTALVFIIIELIVIKASCYFMGVADQVHLLDFLAMIGYNFVGIIVSILVSLGAGKTGKYLCFLYTSIAMSFFVLRSLRNFFLPEAGSDPLVMTSRRKRINSLFAVAALQIVFSYFLLI